MLLAECRNLDGDVDGGRRDQLSNDWEVKHPFLVPSHENIHMMVCTIM